MDRASSTKLAKFLEEQSKRYGTGLTRQDKSIPTYEVIPTGSLALDYATVVGGYVVGRIHLLWGAESMGKTTLAIKAMAEAQKKYPNKLVGYIDMEQTFDWRWAEIWGLDLSESRLTHWFPESSEQASNMLKDMIKTGLYSEIVVDSIGGMIAKDAMDKDAEEYSVGRNAQVITRMCQASSVLARKHRTVVLLISQVRADFKSQRGFDTFAGPKNMRHSQTMRLAFQRTGTYLTVKAEGEDEPIQVGQEIRIKVEESKVAPKGRRATCLIINKTTPEYGPVGLNDADEALTIATRAGVKAIDIAGSWYTLPDGSRHNGRPKVMEHLRKHPAVVEQIRVKALEAVRGDIVPDETVEFTPEGADLEAVDA